MPYKKSAPALRDLCFQAMVKNFKYLRNTIAHLPPCLINELYIRRQKLNLNIRPLPSKLFIHSGTHKLDGPFDLDLSKNKFIYNISNVCRNLAHLSLHGWENISSNNLDNLIKNIPSILHLNLQSTRFVTDQTLSQIGIHCKQLQHLNISCCPGISDVGIRALCVNKNMKIDYLDLSLTHVTPQGCLTALQNLPWLRRFDFSKFPELLNSEEFNSVGDEWQANSLESLPGYLKTEENLETAFRRCPNLRQILVTATNDGLNLLSQFRRLQTIVIHAHKARGIDFNAAIAPALRKARNLCIKHLVLLYVDSVDVGLIGHLFPMLETLKLFWASVSGDLLARKEFSGIPFKHLRKLCLNLTDADVPDWVLRMLLSNCLDLESLMIEKCDTLTDALVFDVVRVNSLKSLKVVNLRECGGISHWGLQLLMEMENPFQYLSINDCCNITARECRILKIFARSRNLNMSISFF